jgi:hypothetical protein
MPLESTEIVSSFTGKISTGRYENESPFFSIKEIWSGDITKEFVLERQNALHGMCFAKFQEAERVSIVERIKKQRSDFRFYPVGNDFYPSVTSILGWDTEWNVPPQQLTQYASRGTIIHYLANHFLKTGEWLDPTKVPELHKDVIIVTTGDLKLSWDDTSFPNFVAKYPIKYTELECLVINNTHRYAGRLDIVGEFDGKVSVMDIKTGDVDEVKCFKQMAAYAMAYGKPIDQMVVIPLNKNTKQGFSAPKISTEINKFFELFLIERRAFKDVFSV